MEKYLAWEFLDLRRNISALFKFMFCHLWTRLENGFDMHFAYLTDEGNYLNHICPRNADVARPKRQKKRFSKFP